jgi:hypothetical protein
LFLADAAFQPVNVRRSWSPTRGVDILILFTSFKGKSGFTRVRGNK